MLSKPKSMLSKGTETNFETKRNVLMNSQKCKLREADTRCLSFFCLPKLNKYSHTKFTVAHTYYKAGVIFCWKPGSSKKLSPIHGTP